MKIIYLCTPIASKYLTSRNDDDDDDDYRHSSHGQPNPGEINLVQTTVIEKVSAWKVDGSVIG